MLPCRLQYPHFQKLISLSNNFSVTKQKTVQLNNT
uniref:Uncharacterized protein n=1 Tax=Rhizophora mucronata TaxID=61149 RepID=A0A2P2MX73_RHIMU